LGLRTAGRVVEQRGSGRKGFFGGGGGLMGGAFGVTLAPGGGGMARDGVAAVF
jgi:hypothetical protein